MICLRLPYCKLCPLSQVEIYIVWELMYFCGHFMKKGSNWPSYAQWTIRSSKHVVDSFEKR